MLAIVALSTYSSTAPLLFSENRYAVGDSVTIILFSEFLGISEQRNDD